AGGKTLAGFENHGGRTILGEGAEPLGRVLAGFGNDGASGYEGCRGGRVYGTYLHGPLLPRNPWFADHLLSQALGVELSPLDDPFTRVSPPLTPNCTSLSLQHLPAGARSEFPYGLSYSSLSPCPIAYIEGAVVPSASEVVVTLADGSTVKIAAKMPPSGISS